METIPKITMVTPSFNQGRYIRETIESVIGQNYPKLEYFIIDGGSTDNSVDIIKEYNDHLDWWISETDEGQADAIYKGFDRATGKILGWLNSDDVLFPGALNKIGNAYGSYPFASIYVGGLAVGAKNEEVIYKCSIPTEPHKIFSRYGIFGFGQPSSFFNANHYREIGCLNRKLFMRLDGDIMYRLTKFRHSVAIIEDMIGFFRRHEDSKSTISEDRYLQEQAAFLGSLGISRLAFAALNVLFRSYRFFKGGYYQSWKATRRYRGKKMSDIWEIEKTIQSEIHR